MTAPYGGQGYGQPAPHGQPAIYGQHGYPGAGTAPGGRGAIMGIGALAILGALAAGIGSFLTWGTIRIVGIAATQVPCAEITVNGLGSMDACGTTSTAGGGVKDGWFTFGSAVLLLIGGIIILAVIGKHKLGGVLALIGGLVAGGVGLYDLLTIEDSAGGVPAQAQQLIEVGPGIGLWLVVVGGVIGVLAGIGGLVKRKR